MVKFERGFTLLELLVVVSIIGILIAMIAAGFGTAQKRSRDARRRGDIKAAQSAFEQYYAENTGYGATCGAMATATYLPAGMPVDPQPGQAYSCTINGSTGSYCICATMESGGGGNSEAACAFGGDATHFCATGLQ